MANNCCFDMKIVGKEDSVREFIRSLKWEDEFEHNGLGRTFSFYEDESTLAHDPRPGSNLISIMGFGDCAWSVLSAMTKESGYDRTLESETERLGICVELYSSEPGCCFQEHYIINNGEFLKDESVDYNEYFIDEDDEELIQELLEELKISREELFENINDNGDYTTGGFSYYGEYEDLFSYFPVEVSKTPLDEQIKAAQIQAAASMPSEKVQER